MVRLRQIAPYCAAHPHAAAGLSAQAGSQVSGNSILKCCLRALFSFSSLISPLAPKKGCMSQTGWRERELGRLPRRENPGYLFLYFSRLPRFTSVLFSGAGGTVAAGARSETARVSSNRVVDFGTPVGTKRSPGERRRGQRFLLIQRAAEATTC